MSAPLGEFERQVLTALVEGYQAREGLKERLRPLNEWEIARRSGYIDLSYAAYGEHPARSKLALALGSLQRAGLIALWETGPKYDSFVPTPAGAASVDRRTQSFDQAFYERQQPAGMADEDPLVQRLDEIIRLLRSLEAKLGAPPSTGTDPE